ncbi:MAG: outer membrane beta-barrel protein [Thermoanaerobaculales bacterium]
MKSESIAAPVCLICLLISASVSAQEQAPISTQSSGGIPVYTNEAIPVGPFLFSPALQLLWQDRDNIFFTPDNKVRDQVYTATARLLFEVPIFESYLQFAYTPQYRQYKDYELEDKWTHIVDVLGAFEFASGLRLNAAYRYFIGNLETREVDPGGELIWGDRRFVKNFVAVDGNYWISQTDGIVFKASWTDLNHDDPDLFYDYTRLDAGVGWLHQLSPILVMDVSYGHIEFDAKDAEDFSNSFRDSSSDDLTVGWRGQLSPVVATEIRVGYRRTSFDLMPGDPPVEDFSGVVANGFISWNMAHDSILRLDVLRSDYPSNSGPNAYYVATGASLMYTLEQGSWYGQARGRFQNNDYELPDLINGEIRSDDIATFGLGLGFRFTELLSLYGTYLYEDRESTIYEATYTTNIFSLGLVFGF